STYYNKEVFFIKMKSLFAFGIDISNIGPKILYSQTEKNFIPINLRAGPSILINLDPYNSVTFMCDLNKLLVPTPDSSIKISDISVASGMFGSFSDAPGGTTEELHEIKYSAGVEYWYDKQLAFRAGYFYEHPTKGGRIFYTLGAGIKYSVFSLDFAYLMPASSNVKSPLANTLRFSLIFDFDALKNQNNTEEKTPIK
ncbi:MAG: PorV/PorQ family protein, partial [Bacteroidales bacterium]|nr:PorV/PorQ family protein [Bacteroidales bacterium]